MNFNVNAARSAGFSDDEIADFLAKENNFDLAGAVSAGFSPSEVVSFLTQAPAPEPAPQADAGVSASDGGRYELPRTIEPSRAGGGRGFVNPPMASQPQPRQATVKADEAALQMYDDIDAGKGRSGMSSYEYRGASPEKKRQLREQSGQVFLSRGEAPATAAPKAQPQPYKSRVEALDDAINFLEEGANKEQVLEAFGKAGITWNEITQHGIANKREYFQQRPADMGIVAPQRLLGGEAVPGEIKAWEPTVGQGIVNTAVRGIEGAGRTVDIVRNRAGLMMPDDVLAERIAQRQRRIGAAMPGSETQQGMQEIGDANEKGFLEAASAIARNPVAGISMLAESVIASSPAVALSIGGSVLGPAGAAVGGFAGGMAMEYGSTIYDTMVDAGMNPASPQDVARALADKDLMARAEKRGAARGITIGAFSALTSGVAASLGRSIKTAVEAGQVGRAARLAGTAGAVGVFGDGTGEYVAQKVVGDKTKYADILMEAAAGLPGALGDAGGAAVGAALRSERGAPEDRLPGVVSFTPDGSLTDLAGLPKVVVPIPPQGAPDVGTDGSVQPAVAGRIEPRGLIGGASVEPSGLAGLGPIGDVRPGADGMAPVDGATRAVGDAGAQRPAPVAGDPLKRTADTDLLARAEAAAPEGAVLAEEPWRGRSKEGFATKGDAAVSLVTRVQRNPNLEWRIEEMPNGRFQLAGYTPAPTQETTNGQVNQPAGQGVAAAAQPGVGPDTGRAAFPATGTVGQSVQPAPAVADGGAAPSGRVLAEIPRAIPAPRSVATRAITALKTGGRGDAKVVPTPQTPAHQAASIMARMMGKTLTHLQYSGGGNPPNAFILTGDTKNIFMDVNADDAPLSLVVHEAGHQLSPERKAVLVREIVGRFKQDQRQDFATTFGYDPEDTATFEGEIVAFFSQAASKRPEFLSQIKDALKNKEFAEAFKVMLDNMRRIVTDMQRKNQYGDPLLDKYFNDVDAGIKVLSKVYADHINEQGGAQTQAGQEAATQQGMQASQRTEAAADVMPPETINADGLQFSLRRIEDINDAPEITMQDLVGETVFPILADLTAAGYMYMGKELRGGPYYTLLPSNTKAGLIWANDDKGVSSIKEKKAKRGVLGLIVAMRQSSHATNATVSKIIFQSIRKEVENNNISQESLPILDDIVRGISKLQGKNQKTGLIEQKYPKFEQFPGFENPEASEKFLREMTFEYRKAFFEEMTKPTVEDFGLGVIRKVINDTIEPDMRGLNKGDVVMAIRFDPDAETIRLGEETGTPEHDSYKFGIKGEVIGKFKRPISFQNVFVDLMAERRANGKDDLDADYRSLTLRKPEQLITQEIANAVGQEKYKTFASPAEAKAAVASRSGQWNMIDRPAGAGVKEFLRTSKIYGDSPNVPSFDEAKAMIKSGMLRIVRLGETENWFAIKDDGRRKVMSSIMVAQPGVNRATIFPDMVKAASEFGATHIDVGGKVAKISDIAASESPVDPIIAELSEMPDADLINLGINPEEINRLNGLLEDGGDQVSPTAVLTFSNRATPADRIRWRKISDVKTEIGLDSLPRHIVPFANFMQTMAEKAGGGGLTSRDLIKAYTIARSSMNRTAVSTEKVKAAGLVLPDNFRDDKIRPEGAFGYWLLSPVGQGYLNAAEVAIVDKVAVADAVKTMAPFGTQNTLGGDLERAANGMLHSRLPAMTKAIVKAAEGKNAVKDWQEATADIYGVREAKKGFLGSLLGFGQLPTFDARQINLNVAADSKEDTLKALSSTKARDVVAKLSRRMDALSLTMDPQYQPFYRHLVHHAVWDAVGGTETTHSDVIDSMVTASNRAQTETPEFKRWFGDSKVVDGQGKPMVMYHSTYSDVSTFTTNFGADEYSKFGVHVGSLEAAQNRIGIKAAEDASQGVRSGNAAPNVMPLYVKAKNPLRLTENRTGRWGVDDIMAAVMDSGVVDPDLVDLFENDALPVSDLDPAAPDVGDEDYDPNAEDRMWSDSESFRPGERSQILRDWLESMGYDSIVYANDFEGGGESYILFRPTQIKSAIGNRGTFEPANPDITASNRAGLSRLAFQGYEKAEVPRVQAARKMAGILAKLDAGTITQQEFELQVRMLADRMSDVVEAKAANRIVSERQRGADIVREKLIAARRRGEVDYDTTEFALWALQQNPAMAEGLGVSVRERAEGSNAAGDYNPASSVMRIFKGAANPTTAVHEILHHTERMMPEEVQAGIRKEWSKAYSKALAKAEPKQRSALEKILEAMAGSTSAQKAVADAFQDGTLDADAHYQLVNPSEFWAVNATDIMSRRYEAGSWIGKAKQWLTEMMERAKGLVGLRSNAPVLRGLKAVLEGNGERLSKKMLSDMAMLQQPAFHGTPHRGIDKFSTDKIGTGEGAQAYGWGLYFASRREIAEFYRKTLAGKRGSRLIDADGNLYMPDGAGMDALVSVYLATNGGDYDATTKELQTTYADMPEVLPSVLEELQRIKDAGIKIDPETQGQLYEVNIPEDSEMLLWDKPLSEQSDANLIREIAEEEDLQINYRKKALNGDRTGEDFYKALSQKLGSDESASRVLNSYGIKGIKYLDGTSRGAGDGSYNYVVFSGDDVAIEQVYYSNRSAPLQGSRFDGKSVEIKNHDRWSVYQEKSAQLRDGYLRWVEDDDAAYVTDIQAGPKARGRAMLEWLKAATGKEIQAVGVVEDAQEFWDKMEEEDLISGQTDEDMMSFFGRGAMFSSNRAPIQGSRFTLPGMDGNRVRWDKIRRALQDDALRMKRVQDAVLAAGGTVNEEQNFYDANTLMPGRVQTMMDDFRNDVIKPMIEKAAKAKIDLEELALYAYAKHAEERNDYIASINPKMPDGGSGMKTADAQKILADIAASGKQAQYDDLHQDLMSITETTRRVLLDEGLITQEQFDAMEQQYGNYIPLRGFENVDEETGAIRPGIGRGINVRGKETIKALGRASRAGDLIENVIRDYQRAVVRSEKNNVGKVLLDFVLSNPDSDLWGVDVDKTTTSFDKNRGIVQYTKTIDKGEDTIGVKVAGQQVYIKLADKDLTRALKQSFKDEVSGLERATVAMSGWYNNLMRNVLTRYNPPFAMVNAIRDAQSGLVAAVDELGVKGAARFSAHLPKAIAATTADETGWKSLSNPLTQQYLREFKASGAVTGGFYMRNLDDIAKDLRDDLLMAGAAPRTLSEKAKFNRGTKLAYKGARKFLRGLELMGAASENATRFALYMAARDMGRTPAQAALLAKNGTTNFNRKGEWGGALNNLYLFFTAAIQGNAQLLKTLKNPKVAAALTGVAGLTVSLAFLNAGMGGEDDDGEKYWDKVPNYEKERNLIIMLTPGDGIGDGVSRVGKRGRYIKIPVQYGLNFFPNLGYSISDIIRNKQDPRQGKTVAKAGMHMASTFFGSMNPFGGAVDLTDSVSIAMAAAPTIIDPVIQIMSGRNAFGTPTVPDKFPGDTRPDSERMFISQMDGFAADLAKMLNEMGGGNQSKAGSILGVETAVAPGTIKTVIAATTGGLGTFFEQIYDTTTGAISDDKNVKTNRIPLLNKVYGEAAEDVNVRLAGDRMREVGAAVKVIKDQIEDGIKPDVTDTDRRLMSISSAQEAYNKESSRLRKEEIAVIRSTTMTPEQKRLARDNIMAARDKMATAVNRVYLNSFGAQEKGAAK